MDQRVARFQFPENFGDVVVAPEDDSLDLIEQRVDDEAVSLSRASSIAPGDVVADELVFDGALKLLA
jgi:hypothetical protein